MSFRATKTLLLAVVVVPGVAAVATLDATQSPLPSGLWVDATEAALPETAEWTNKVELADINGDGHIDLLFANGGNYSQPGELEGNRAFVNRGDATFEEVSAAVFGGTPDISRVIKARDVDGDGNTDIFVGTTYQSQSRIYFGTGGGFEERTATHLPQMPLSVGDAEFGDADGDGDLDLVLADWGPGNNMSNDGGRTRLWLNEGNASGRFVDATDDRMPDVRVRFSWDLEFVDVDNDLDLDVLVSCKRCGGSFMFRNDGDGAFEYRGGLPQYTNNYEFEAMDLDGDELLDLVTINDGEIVGERGSSRREHVFRNSGERGYRDATEGWWPASENIGEDDNIIAFLDFDSDGDADFLIGSLSGPDRLIVNNGPGAFRNAAEVFVGPDTPGTLGMALADLDGDGRMDVVQAQGEHPEAIQERVFLGTGLAADTAAPDISIVTTTPAEGGGATLVRARVHDRKSPLLDTELLVEVTSTSASGETVTTPMQWYGEYLWRAEQHPDATIREICATDASGNRTCAEVNDAE